MREQLESLQQQKKEGSDSQQQLGSAPKRKLKNFAFKTTSTNSASSNAPSSSQSHLAGFPSGDGEDPRLKKYREQYKQKLDEQKTSSGPATPLSSYSKFKDEKEKKAAILAKYGFKQRDFDGGVDTSSSSQSSSDDDDDDDYELDENNIPKHIARSNILYSIYGDRLTGGGSEVGKREKSSASSVATLKNILGTVRGANNPHCRRRSESDSDSEESGDEEDEEDLENVPGSCRNIRTRFENSVQRRQMSPQAPVLRRPRPEKSSSCANVRLMFESSAEDTNQGTLVSF